MGGSAPLDRSSPTHVCLPTFLAFVAATLHKAWVALRLWTGAAPPMCAYLPCLCSSNFTQGMDGFASLDRSSNQAAQGCSSDVLMAEAGHNNHSALTHSRELCEAAKRALTACLARSVCVAV
eukprot:1159472-Pelagomonas_calceolata.AAC.5